VDDGGYAVSGIIGVEGEGVVGVGDGGEGA